MSNGRISNTKLYFSTRIGLSCRRNVVCRVERGIQGSCGLERAARKMKYSPLVPCVVCRQGPWPAVSELRSQLQRLPSPIAVATSGLHAC